jgi:hypothetical protein
MQTQNGASPPTPKACPNSAHRYLFAIAPAGADLVLLFGLLVLDCGLL